MVIVWHGPLQRLAAAYLHPLYRVIFAGELSKVQSLGRLSITSALHRYLRRTYHIAKMVDAFCATWKLVDSQNFDEYMKELGKFLLF